MPAKSQQQMKYIYAMRNKYKSKRKAPKNMKWLFDEEWTKGVKMKKLPNKVKNESHIMNFHLFNESEVNVDYEGDEEDYLLYGDQEEESSCGCKNCNCKDCDGGNCGCGCCKKDTEEKSEEKISENKVSVKDTYVDFEDMDEYIQPRLNIVTSDNKKYYVNLKSFDDFDDDEEW